MSVLPVVEMRRRPRIIPGTFFYSNTAPLLLLLLPLLVFVHNSRNLPTNLVSRTTSNNNNNKVLLFVDAFTFQQSSFRHTCCQRHINNRLLVESNQINYPVTKEFSSNNRKTNNKYNNNDKSYSYYYSSQLGMQNNYGNNNESDTKRRGGGTIRFSGLQQSSSSSGRIVTNPFDAILSWIASDIGSIAIGIIGLLLLLVYKLIVDNMTSRSTTTIPSAAQIGQETRSNLLAVFAIGSILLNGLSKLDVQSVVAEAVVLDGIPTPNVVVLVEELNQRTLKTTTTTNIEWVLESILVATPASTVVLLESTNHNNNKNDPASIEESNWKVVAYTGIVPPNLIAASSISSSSKVTTPTTILLPANTPILNRFLSSSARRDGSTGETYLPTLQALPGRIELTTNSILPTNTQAALLVPPAENKNALTASNFVVVLGSNVARSFTPRDIAWCQAAITRLVV